MAARIVKIAAFLAGVAAFAAALSLANRLPAAVQPDLLRRYSRVDEVRSALRLNVLLVPSYFPQELSWPPRAILAQGRPFPAVVMEFARAGGRDAVLVIAQWEAGRTLSEGTVRMARARESVRYSLGGRDALLSVGTGPQGEQISRIGWTEGKFRVEVEAKVPPVELIRVAESMVR